MSDQESYNPYCPVCEGCGEEGCCSPIHCQQTPEGSYCKGYLRDLKFGYAMNSFFQEKIWGRMSEELKEEYDREWDKVYDQFYNQDNK
jgi:hypothetical protein